VTNSLTWVQPTTKRYRRARRGIRRYELAVPKLGDEAYEVTLGVARQGSIRPDRTGEIYGGLRGTREKLVRGDAEPLRQADHKLK